jgi:hypothetical protein
MTDSENSLEYSRSGLISMSKEIDQTLGENNVKEIRTMSKKSKLIVAIGATQTH